MLASPIGGTVVCQAFLEVIYLGWISYEETQSGIDLSLPGVVGDHTVCQTADHRIARPVFGCGLRVLAKEGWIAIGASADRAL